MIRKKILSFPIQLSPSVNKKPLLSLIMLHRCLKPQSMISAVVELPKDSIAAEDILAQPFYEHNSFAELTISDSLSHEGNSTYGSSELYSDVVLDYINRMLMEEDLGDEYDLLQGHPALEATEKPFYDLIGEKHPSLSPDPPVLFSNPSPESTGSNGGHNSNRSGSSIPSFFHSNSEFAQYTVYQISPSQSSSSSGNDGSGFGEGLAFHEDRFSDLFFKSLPSSEFEKGVQEAKKFLPSEDKLLINVGVDLTLPREPVKGSRQKNRHSEKPGFDEMRRTKQSAFSNEEQAVPWEMFDDVLLCSGEKFPIVVKAIREKLYNEARKTSKGSESKVSGGGRKSRRKKQSVEEVADINTLLLHCAQTVAAGDNSRAHELLRQIRQHSSPHGDASQRIALYVADGLEARLAGTGSEVYHSLVAKRRTATDVLNAYQLYLASCPFKKISYHFANQTILDTIQNETRVHIIDFGIFFGFQWPVFLKLLSERPGGPPKLRITGIDIPEPGFRPMERVKETGRWLAGYADRFCIPFEYHGVAANFDEVNVESLHIEEGEMLVVNCLFRLHNLGDETVLEDCPRDKVLNTIRKLNPAVFVNVIVNGTYGAPFFMTRFREALYHFSGLFDMLEMTVPRESRQRLLLERDLYGRILINVIACEGLERERPETYKQWQVRCLRAGFEQLSISKEYVKKLRDGVRSMYHKDFNTDEDGRWLLQGWKGRILNALSAWKPRCV